MLGRVVICYVHEMHITFYLITYFEVFCSKGKLSWFLLFTAESNQCSHIFYVFVVGRLLLVSGNKCVPMWFVKRLCSK